MRAELDRSKTARNAHLATIGRACGLELDAWLSDQWRFGSVERMNLILGRTTRQTRTSKPGSVPP
jgi:hypothetical protein